LAAGGMGLSGNVIMCKEKLLFTIYDMPTLQVKLILINSPVFFISFKSRPTNTYALKSIMHTYMLVWRD